MSYYEVSLGGSNLNLDDQAWIVVEYADCCYLSSKITDRLMARRVLCNQIGLLQTDIADILNLRFTA